MKRKIGFLLAALLLLASLSPAALAAGQSFVSDQAGLLTSDEQASLEEKAQQLQDIYDIEVYIVTVDSLGGESAQAYADDFFDDNAEGYDGIVFLLAMESREWYISTCGNAIYALTDYGIEQVGTAAVEGGLSGGDYYSGFAAFLDAVPEYLDSYESGQPIDGYASYSGDYYHGDREEVLYYQQNRSPNLILAAFIGLIAAGVVLLILWRQMNTRRAQYGASAYMREGSFRLNLVQDLFLYSSMSRTPRPERQGGGPHGGGHHGGGSSVHHSSGGRSHGGGGGHF